MINNLINCKTKEEVYDFLVKYLNNELELLQRESESEKSFDKAAWSEYHAHLLGQRKAHRKILNLFPDQRKK